MPFRLNEHRAKLQFVGPNWMPNMIYMACKKTGIVSNTVYMQHAICEALARDLDLDLAKLLDDLPPPRGHSNQLSARSEIGPANTVEEVR